MQLSPTVLAMTTCAAVAALAFGVAGCASPAAPGGELPAGLYRQAATRCTPQVNTTARACAPAVQDCVLLGPVQADGQRRVEVFSTQANQHVCMAQGQARPGPQGLALADPQAGPGQGVALRREGPALVLRHLAPARAGLAPFCGARAALDGLSFPLASRVADSGTCVPSDMK
jgi:hypothetical protein